MYWPSNLAEPCAHATLPSPVPSRRPSPSHLNISIFPFRFRVQVTTSKARWATDAASLLSIRKMTADLVPQPSRARGNGNPHLLRLMRGVSFTRGAGSIPDNGLVLDLPGLAWAERQRLKQSIPPEWERQAQDARYE
jgi:hypothetical protein